MKKLKYFSFASLNLNKSRESGQGVENIPVLGYTYSRRALGSTRMKNCILSFLAVLLVFHIGVARSQTAFLPAYEGSSGPIPVSTTNPLPAAVYTSATAGSVLTSNGSGAATFQSGGSHTGVRTIASGTSDTASATDSLIAWNSAATSAKTESIPAPTTMGATLTIKDAYGNAGTYNITVTPASGTIDGQSNNVIQTNGKSITLVADGVSNWMVI